MQNGQFHAVAHLLSDRFDRILHGHQRLYKEKIKSPYGCCKSKPDSPVIKLRL
jgi:hypothetical protein